METSIIQRGLKKPVFISWFVCFNQNPTDDQIHTLLNFDNNSEKCTVEQRTGICDIKDGIVHLKGILHAFISMFQLKKKLKNELQTKTVIKILCPECHDKMRILVLDKILCEGCGGIFYLMIIS